MKTTDTCKGALAYESMAGVIRVHRDGRYRYRCQKCEHEGENDGTPRTHQEPTCLKKEVER